MYNYIYFKIKDKHYIVHSHSLSRITGDLRYFTYFTIKTIFCYVMGICMCIYEIYAHIYADILHIKIKCILKHHIISTVKSANSDSSNKSSLLKGNSLNESSLLKGKNVHLYNIICLEVIFDYGVV